MDDPMAEGDVGAACHLEFADLEPARVTKPREEVPPRRFVLLHPPELWRASHIEHANIDGVMSNDAGEVMSFDSFCPCCNQPTNLSFISVLSGCAHTGPHCSHSVSVQPIAVVRLIGFSLAGLILRKT
jgi:hypothetical protein